MNVLHVYVFVHCAYLCVSVCVFMFLCMCMCYYIHGLERIHGSNLESLSQAVAHVDLVHGYYDDTGKQKGQAEQETKLYYVPYLYMCVKICVHIHCIRICNACIHLSKDLALAA